MKAHTKKQLSEAHYVSTLICRHEWLNSISLVGDGRLNPSNTWSMNLWSPFVRRTCLVDK